MAGIYYYIMKTLILGVGNTLYCDDGIGIYIAGELNKHLKNNPDITIEEASIGGINLMELLVGYDRAIIIDAIQLKQFSPGYIYRLTMDSLVTTRHANSPHDTDFTTALDIGKKLDLPLPNEIIIYAVEVEDVTSFTEGCTLKVKEAIPECIDMILNELRLNKKEHRQ